MQKTKDVGRNVNGKVAPELSTTLPSCRGSFIPWKEPPIHIE
jgi:hypothetical protein